MTNANPVTEIKDRVTMEEHVHQVLRSTKPTAKAYLELLKRTFGRDRIERWVATYQPEASNLPRK